jgi:predicted dehydrogenase
MTLSETLGLTRKKVRYAIVGLGDIAQENMMPGVSHTGNSEITALVTSDPVKARELSKKYGVEHACTYPEFASFLKEGYFDAAYIATPNWRHAEFAVPALEAGIHVLVEKPLEVSRELCLQIYEAQKKSGAKVMTAYRLHFEPATLDVLQLVRSGALGKIKLFSSVFTQNVKPENHRALNGEWAGPLFDMGPYPINAVRNIFGMEPIEVSAEGIRHPLSGLGDFDHTVSVTMRFPDEALAQFVVSYVGDSLDSYTVVGTEGSVVVSPAYMFGKSLSYELIQKGNREKKSFTNTDHFGGELKHFSDCILNNLDPEPDLEEGFLDVRVIEAIMLSLKSGQRQPLELCGRSKEISPDQVEKLSPVSTPTLVNVESPSRK